MNKIGLMILMLSVSAVVLTGCGNEDVTETNAETTEIASEEPTEVVSENVSAEPTEEITEAVDETDYSAEAVMALVDSLIETYQYDDPEHIKAAVIAANLDYISEEDLETLLSTYGYTVESINEVYIGFLTDHTNDFHDTHDYYNGEVEVPVSAEHDYQYRVKLSSLMMNDSDKEYAEKVDKLMDESSRFAVLGKDVDELVTGEIKNNSENFCVSYVYELYYHTLCKTPFEKYVNTEKKLNVDLIKTENKGFYR
ncbi:MAG: hypothetical protein IJ291_00795 [Lachnospiraceae bacterium]|nr:hypothetical protein [Lachnospiraceae bacterium]